jgi:Mg-chelatase subunit ChlD
MLAAQDEVEEMAWIAAKQLGAAADTGIDKQLAKMAKARQPHQRIAAAIILGERLTAGSTEALDALLKLGKDRDWTVQTAVSDALGIAAPKDEASTAAIEELLIPRLGSDDWAIRNSAGWALARLGSSAAVPAMIKGLKLDDPNIAALQGMLRLGALETPSAWKNWLAQQGDAAIQAHRWGEIKDRTSVEFYEINEETGRVCYIIDTSGSMAKAGRLGSASRELWRSAKDLAIGTHVNIITFADRVTVWQPVPLRATWRSKGMIKRYLATLGPRGSTNTSGALGRCLDLWGIETAFLLTDGMPTVGIKEPKGIIEHISYRNHLREEPVRLHTIAFHLPAGAAFLKELAQRNKGTSRLIQ